MRSSDWVVTAANMSCTSSTFTSVSVVLLSEKKKLCCIISWIFFRQCFCPSLLRFRKSQHSPPRFLTEAHEGQTRLPDPIPSQLTCGALTVSTPSSDWSSFLGISLLIGSLQTQPGRWTGEWATSGPWVASQTPSHHGNTLVGPSLLQPPPLWLVHTSVRSDHVTEEDLVRVPLRFRQIKSNDSKIKNSSTQNPEKYKKRKRKCYIWEITCNNMICWTYFHNST